MWITDFNDYKAFLKALMKTYPKSGRGQSRRLAEHLNVAPIVVSQIVARDRHFTPDQALKVASHFGMDEKTSEYFVFLVNHARAETRELKSFYKSKLERLRKDAENIKNLVRNKKLLSEENKGIYYSNWYYAAVHLLTSIGQFQTVDALAEYLGLSRTKVGEIVAFMLDTGICVEGPGGKIIRGSTSIHVDSNSPYVNSHRRNWRDKAREKFTSPGENDLFYSSVVALSEKDADRFRKTLLQLIENFSKKVVAPSPEETTRCLNIDWFKF